MAIGGPERIYDITIISKIPVTFASVMFAPKILATLPELVEYYKKDLARLRLIARDAAVTAELRIRSRHGTWRFFLVTPDSLVEIDREGKPRISFDDRLGLRPLLSPAPPAPSPPLSSASQKREQITAPRKMSCGLES